MITDAEVKAKATQLLEFLLYDGELDDDMDVLDILTFTLSCFIGMLHRTDVKEDLSVEEIAMRGNVAKLIKNYGRAKRAPSLN